MVDFLHPEDLAKYMETHQVKLLGKIVRLGDWLGNIVRLGDWSGKIVRLLDWSGNIVRLGDSLGNIVCKIVCWFDFQFTHTIYWSNK